MKATVLLRALDGSLGSERCSPGGPVAAGTPCRPFPSLVTAGSSLWLRQADSARGVSGGANRHPPLFLTRSVLVCRGRSGLDMALGTFCVIDAPDGVTRRRPTPASETTTAHEVPDTRGRSPGSRGQGGKRHVGVSVTQATPRTTGGGSLCAGTQLPQSSGSGCLRHLSPGNENEQDPSLQTAPRAGLAGPHWDFGV